MAMNEFEAKFLDVLAASVLDEFLSWVKMQEASACEHILTALEVTGLVDEGLQKGYPLETLHLQTAMDAASFLRDLAQAYGFDLMAGFFGEEAQRFQATLG